MLAHEPYLVFTSTDQVYDAPANVRSIEEHPQPSNVYGLTKLWGEAVTRGHSKSCCLRLNFFSIGNPDRPGLADFYISALRTGTAIKVFEDVWFNPLYGSHLADALLAVIDARPEGIFNLGASGPGVTKAEFARMIALEAGFDSSEFVSASTDDIPARARRPKGMIMAVNKIEMELGIKLPTVHLGVRALAGDLAEMDRK